MRKPFVLLRKFIKRSGESDSKVDALDARINAMDKRLDEMDTATDALKERVKANEDAIENHEERITEMEPAPKYGLVVVAGFGGISVSGTVTP